MIIYADVLIFLNLIIDYLIIKLTSKVTSCYIKFYRAVISAFVAALFSLKILLPEYNFILEFLIIIFSGILITLIAFGKNKLFKNLMVFLTINIVYNGLMTFVWEFFNPKGMIINNSVVYFNISPIIFIFLTIVFYLIISLTQAIIKKLSPCAARCIVKIKNKNNIIEFVALVDTGNSISDPYNNRHVIITDLRTAKLIFGDLSKIPQFLLPVRTVNGNGILPSYLCKYVQINSGKIIPALIAVTEYNFSDDYKAIVNPKIFEEV